MKLINKVKIILLIIFFMLLILATKSFAVTGVITEITVNLREKPSTDSKKIMYVTQDDEVEVLEKAGDWYKIKFENTTGYVFGKYVKVDDTKLNETTDESNEKDEETVDITKKEDTTTKTEETTDVNQGEVKKEEQQEVATNTNLIVKSKTQIKIVPNISSSVIYTTSKNLEVNIIEQINDWTYVSVDGVYGWVRTDKIVEKSEVSAEEDKKVETKIAYVKYSSVNLREKASTGSKSLAKLKLNDEVTVLEETNSKWSKVEADGITGYVSTELLADKKQEEKQTDDNESSTTSRDSETTSRNEDKNTEKDENKKVETKEETTTTKTDKTVNTTSTSKKEENNKESTSKVTGEDIVAYAKKYLGYDYVYGGSSPKTGFDCSGFTYYVYKHFGYTISRSSKAQATNGKAVAKSNLQPGDLIIFKNQSLTAIGHVGIYVGDNKIIHASEPGVGVVITNMNASGYNYNKRYVTARRII